MPTVRDSLAHAITPMMKLRPRRCPPSLTPAATLAALLAAAPAGAQLGFGDAPPPERRAADLVKVTAAADVEVVAPEQTFHVAVRFAIEPRWHIYWRNPGDSGAATSVKVRGPAGFRIGAPRFPRPIAMREPEGITFGYEEETVILVPVTAPATLAPGRADFDVDVFYFVCRDVCMIGEAKLLVGVEATETSMGGEPPRPRADKTIDRFRRRLPAPIATLEGARAVREGDRVVVTGPALGFDGLQFFPDPSPGVNPGAAAVTIEQDRFRLVVPLALEPQNALGERMTLRGLIGLGRRLDDPCYEIEIALDDARPAEPALPPG
jgi:thiol:disulfide interchange protein DsbD